MASSSSLSAYFDDAVFDESLFTSSLDEGWMTSDTAPWPPAASSHCSFDEPAAWMSYADNTTDAFHSFLPSDGDLPWPDAPDVISDEGFSLPSSGRSVNVVPSAAPRELLVFASLGPERARKMESTSKQRLGTEEKDTNARNAVLVCTLCHMAQACPTWTKMSSHWRSRNHSSCPKVTLAERELARQTWERHQHDVLMSPDEWEPLDRPVAAIKHINTFVGYRCAVPGCLTGYVQPSKSHRRPDHSAWQQHMRHDHNQHEFDTPGRPAVASAHASRSENNEYDTPWGPLVRAQRVFAKRPCHAVLDNDSHDAVTLEEDADGQEADNTAWFAQFDQMADGVRRRDEERLRTITAPTGYQVDAWARGAGFSARLDGFQYAAARRVCDRPDARDEATELAAAVWSVTGSALRKAHEKARKTGDYKRELIGRIQPNHTSVKPWTPYTVDGSISNHVRTMQACLGFFVRTQLVDADARAVPRYDIDAAVEEAWRALEQELMALRDQGCLPSATTKGDDIAKPLTLVERLTLGLLVCLLRQQGHIDEATELPLAVALTVLAIVPGNTVFARPGDYTRLLAGFDKMARCAVFAYAEATDLSSLEALVGACVVRGPNHTMTWVGRKKAYAREVGKTTPTQGRLTWIPASESFLYGEHQLSLTQLRAIVHNALNEQQRILCDELLFVQCLNDLPSIPWDTIVDRRDHASRGSCWTDPCNKDTLSAGVNWLRNHIGTTQQARFLARDGSGIQQRAVLQFKRSMEHFAEQGMPLAVWAIGMPIRGTTVTSYRWRNSDDGQELRNLVVQGGRLTLVGGHTKTQWTGSQAPMHVLPREVAGLWAWYVWLVLPFWSTVRSVCTDVATHVDDEAFLFPPPSSQVPSTWVSGALTRASASVVPGGGFGLQPGRQLMLGFVRRYTPSDILSGGKSAQLDARRQLTTQRAAVAKAGARLGVRNVGWDDDSNDRDDNTDSGDDNDARDGDMDPDDVGTGFVIQPNEQDVFEEVRNLIKVRSACEMASGHSTRTGFANYGGDVQAIRGIDELQLALWSAVSAHWHSVLCFPSAIAGCAPRKRRRASSTYASGVRGRKEDGKRLHLSKDVCSGPRISVTKPAKVQEEEVLEVLRDLLQRPHAQFRGNQWPAFDIMLNQSYGALVVIEPTGGGKTALILLPAALAAARTTIVVTPFVALREQLMDQCHAADIACTAWTDGAAHDLGLYLHAKIIIVSAEHISHPSFHALVRKMHGAQQIERIVVDEVHLPLIAGHWRQSLSSYAELATLGVPLVLLSGTLPVTHEQRLFKGMRVDASRAHVLRSSTVRRNIKYSVVNLRHAVQEKNGTSDDWLVCYLQQYRAAFPLGKRKTMVFVSSVAAAKCLAERVSGASAYYHDVVDGSRIVADFAALSDRVLFCTSAAEHGIHVLDVDHVIYAYSPDSLTSYLQGAGRAGRDGRPATSVLLVGDGIRAFRATSQQAINDRQVVEQYAHAVSHSQKTLCRRRFIDEYMDGNNSRQRCEERESELPCDVCDLLANDTSDENSGAADPRQPATPPPAYADIPSATAGHHITLSAPTQLHSAKNDVACVSKSSSSLPALRTGILPQIAPLTPACRLNTTRREDTMAWRAVWGPNGRARPLPLDRIRSTLSFWKLNCTAHLLAGGDSAHMSAECDGIREEHARIKQAARVWNKSEFEMAQWTGCWACKVPKEFCRGGGNCSREWSHVVVDAWATCLLYPASLKWLQLTLSARGLKEDMASLAVKAYLGKKIRLPNKPDRIETIPLIDLLVETTERFFFTQPITLGSLQAYIDWGTTPVE